MRLGWKVFLPLSLFLFFFSLSLTFFSPFLVNTDFIPYFVSFFSSVFDLFCNFSFIMFSFFLNFINNIFLLLLDLYYIHVHYSELYYLTIFYWVEYFFPLVYDWGFPYSAHFYSYWCVYINFYLQIVEFSVFSLYHPLDCRLIILHDLMYVRPHQVMPEGINSYAMEKSRELLLEKHANYVSYGEFMSRVLK